MELITDSPRLVRTCIASRVESYSSYQAVEMPHPPWDPFVVQPKPIIQCQTQYHVW